MESLGAAAPSGFADGQSLAIPISRAGPWSNVQAAVGWALMSAGKCTAGMSPARLTRGLTAPAHPCAASQELHPQVDALADERRGAGVPQQP